MKRDLEQVDVSFTTVTTSGHAQALDDQPMRDLTALPIDSMSPVNRHAAFI